MASPSSSAKASTVKSASPFFAITLERAASFSLTGGRFSTEERHFSSSFERIRGERISSFSDIPL